MISSIAVKQHRSTGQSCGRSSGRRHSKLPMPGGPALPEPPPLFAPSSSNRSPYLCNLQPPMAKPASPPSTSLALPLQPRTPPPLSPADAPPRAPAQPPAPYPSAAAKSLLEPFHSRRAFPFAGAFVDLLLFLTLSHGAQGASKPTVVFVLGGPGCGKGTQVLAAAAYEAFCSQPPVSSPFELV